MSEISPKKFFRKLAADTEKDLDSLFMKFDRFGTVSETNRERIDRLITKEVYEKTLIKHLFHNGREVDLNKI